MRQLKDAVPNLISLLRLALIIPFIYALSRGEIAVSLALAVVIVLSDFLDGYLARIWGSVSETGKVLDPLADKICTAVGAIGLINYRAFPPWLVVIVIGRDIGIMIAGSILIHYKHYVPVSDTIGKIAMVVLSACLLVYLFDIEFLKVPLIAVTLVTQAASAISYGRQFVRAMFGGTA